MYWHVDVRIPLRDIDAGFNARQIKSPIPVSQSVILGDGSITRTETLPNGSGKYFRFAGAYRMAWSKGETNALILPGLDWSVAAPHMSKAGPWVQRN